MAATTTRDLLANLVTVGTGSNRATSIDKAPCPKPVQGKGKVECVNYLLTRELAKQLDGKPTATADTLATELASWFPADTKFQAVSKYRQYYNKGVAGQGPCKVVQGKDGAADTYEATTATVLLDKLAGGKGKGLALAQAVLASGKGLALGHKPQAK